MHSRSGWDCSSAGSMSDFSSSIILHSCDYQPRILLIEIHAGKPIKIYRIPEDLTNSSEINANTDWTIADRVIKSLDDYSLGYKEAIQACLDIPWIPAGQRVSLDNNVTRNGLFNNVIQPLEDELRHLFKEKF